MLQALPPPLPPMGWVVVGGGILPFHPVVMAVVVGVVYSPSSPVVMAVVVGGGSYVNW